MKTGLFVSLFIALPMVSIGQVGHAPIEQHRWVKISDSLAQLPAVQPEMLLNGLHAVDTTSEAGRVVHFALGWYYFKKRKFAEARAWLQKAVRQPFSDAADRAAVLFSLGKVTSGIYHYVEAMELLDSALTAAQTAYGPESHSEARIIMEVANVYRACGDFEKSEDYGKKAVRMLQHLGLSEHRDYGGAHHNLGLTAFNEGDYEKSIQYYRIALRNFEKSFGEHPQTAITLSTIGSVFTKMKQGKEALQYQLRATEMFQRTAPAEHPAMPAFQICLASAYRSEGQFEQARQALLKAKALEKYKLPSTELCVGLAETYQKLGQLDSALAYLDTAMLGLKNLANDLNQEQTFRDYVWEVLLIRAEVHAQYYKKTGDVEHLKTAAQVLRTAREVVMSLLQDFDARQNKLAYYRQAVRGFDKSIGIHADLWAITRDSAHLRAAFENAEASKSLLLRQQLHAQRNRRASHLLVEQKWQLRQQLEELQKMKFENENETRADSIDEVIFLLKIQLDRIRESILKVMPDYFDPLPPLQIQTLPGMPVLEFFIGEKEIFTFLVKDEGITLHRTPNDFQLENRIRQLRESICRYFLSEEKTSDLYMTSARAYAEQAYFLYQVLIEPFIHLLPKRFVIVPDGVLNYLPFEVLLMTPPARPDRFHLMHYFSKDYTVSYQYSLSLLNESQLLHKQALPAEDKLLALAPFVKTSADHLQHSPAAAQPPSDHLTNLPFSGEEVYAIAQLTGGTYYLNDVVVKSFFLEHAKKYQVLHLATHAQANDRAGDFSFLYFRGAEGRGSVKLYVSEISGMTLSAELVTLSACETGVGQLLLGEGMVSIARAFFSAGARSLLQTLWVVSDSSISRLMIAFYENLKKGVPKDVALAAARKQYLQQARGEAAHPFYWASMVLLGDMRAMPASF